MKCLLLNNIFKKKQPQPRFKIAFCDTPDLATKFGEYSVVYNTYEAAEWVIWKSKVSGWRHVILNQPENFLPNKPKNAWKSDGAWLVIETID